MGVQKTRLDRHAEADWGSWGSVWGELGAALPRLYLEQALVCEPGFLRLTYNYHCWSEICQLSVSYTKTDLP